MGIKIKDFNFDKLLAPYADGGTEQAPVKRTLGTITTKLIVGNRFSPEVVGLAIFKVFNEMANGLKFEGNGKYGSKGAELFSCIKAQCVDIQQKQSENETTVAILQRIACVKDCPVRSVKVESRSRWQKIKRFFMRPRGPFWGI